MSREVRRVPVDFDWPLSKTWKGYVRPVDLDGDPCTACNASGRTHFGAWIEAFAHTIAMLASDVHDRKRGRPEMHPWLKGFGHAPGHFEYLRDGEWLPSEVLRHRGVEPGPECWCEPLAAPGRWQHRGPAPHLFEPAVGDDITAAGQPTAIHQ